MASKKPKSVSVSGLSVNDIMEIDLDTFNKLGEKDLRAYTSRLVSASNKRIRRLEKHGIVSPAYSSLGTDVRFSTKLPKGTSKQQRVNALRNEFGFEDLPSNMMPVAQLEAIIGTILAEEKLKGNTKQIFEFRGIDVINMA